MLSLLLPSLSHTTLLWCAISLLSISLLSCWQSPVNMSSDADCNNGDESDIEDDDALPKLKSIWDCHQINKGVVPGPDGLSVAGWTCSWCPGGGRSFKGDNATNALAHVAKIAGKNIMFCKGNIPRNKIIQYRNL